MRVVGFNRTTERWSQDVSADVAHELRRRCDLQLRDVPFFLQDFVDRYEGRYRDVQLPLPIRLVRMTAFQRKNPAAIGVKAPFPGVHRASPGDVDWRNVCGDGASTRLFGLSRLTYKTPLT